MNLEHLRLVILDYPKLVLNNPDTKRALADMIVSKQINFERSSQSYVPMSGLDMISTHFMIYDLQNPFQPKPILAIRICFETRAAFHDLPLPIEQYIGVAPESYQNKFQQFRKANSPLVDCNAWFVDPDYTFTKTNVSLSDIAYFMVVTFILRKGLHNWVGATNERFKASRWASKTGYFEDGLIFTHHLVKDPHKLILIKDFNYEWLHDCMIKYGDLLQSSFLIAPDEAASKEKLFSLSEIFSNIEDQYADQRKPAQKLA